RIPASFTGIVGFKQSFGRVPAHPLSPFGTLAHVGPMTRSVADAALMLSVVAQPDPRDWYALPHGGRDYLDGLEDGMRGWKIAFSPTLGSPTLGDRQVEPEVARLVQEAALAFRELGAVVEEAEPEIGPDCGSVFANHWYPGAANAIRGYSPAQ